MDHASMRKATGAPVCRGGRRAVRAACFACGALAALGAALALLAPPAYAQSGQPGGTEFDLVTVSDNAEQLLRQGRYKEAVALYEKLHGADSANMEYRLNLALCWYETGDLKKAQQMYEQVLNQLEPNNIVALIQSARVKSRLSAKAPDPQTREQLIDEAQKALRLAAQFGANCLQAINAYDELALFRNDIKLQIKLIEAPKMARALRTRRDPFRNPLPKKSETDDPSRLDPTAGSSITPAEQRELVRRLRELVARIDALLDSKDYEQISKLWLEIEDIIKQNEGVTVLELQSEFATLRQKADEKRYLIKGLLLRGFYAQGERILTDMEVALNESDYARVFSEWQELNKHARQMVQTEADFEQTANDLLARGKGIHDQAKLLEEIDKFSFRITGIVSGGGVAKAIINDRVVGENDQVYGPDRLPIPGLKVVKIKRRRVRFRYKDTDFERPLRQ